MSNIVYRIKNWVEFQHYKDRSPPWIKLHNSLLTEEVWVMGNDATRALVIASMLLASRNNANDGSFNGDPEYVKRFAYLNTKPDFKPLIQYNFIELVQDASVVLASCNTEERREEENRSAEKPLKFSFLDSLVAIGADESIAKDWLAVRKIKKASDTKTAFDGFAREVKKSGVDINKVLQICCEKNWKGFDASWINGQQIQQLKTAQVIDVEYVKEKRKAELESARKAYRAQMQNETIPPSGGVQ